MNDMHNPVSHPDHYQSASDLECIDVIREATADLSGEQAFCAGNIVKYAFRCRDKGGMEDARKIREYFRMLLNPSKSTRLEENSHE